MHISMGTFIIMAVNFLLLLLILKLLLYRPLQEMLEQRRQKISADLSEAEKARQQYENLRHEAKKTLDQAYQEAKVIIDRARQEAAKTRDEVIGSARQEADQLRERTRQEMERARRTAEMELRAGVVDLALTAAGKVIGNNMTPNINENLIRQALEQISKEGTGNASSRSF